MHWLRRHRHNPLCQDDAVTHFISIVRQDPRNWCSHHQHAVINNKTEASRKYNRNRVRYIKCVKSKKSKQKINIWHFTTRIHTSSAAVHGDKWLGNSCRGTAALQCPLCSTLASSPHLHTTHISHLSSLVVIIKSHISFL